MMYIDWVHWTCTVVKPWPSLNPLRIDDLIGFSVLLNSGERDTEDISTGCAVTSAGSMSLLTFICSENYPWSPSTVIAQSKVSSSLSFLPPQLSVL